MISLLGRILIFPMGVMMSGPFAIWGCVASFIIGVVLTAAVFLLLL